MSSVKASLLLNTINFARYKLDKTPKHQRKNDGMSGRVNINDP